MFIFHVEAETPAALADKIVEKLLLSGLIALVEDSQPVSPFPPVDHEPPSVKLPEEVISPPVAATATVAAGISQPQSSGAASAPQGSSSSPATPGPTGPTELRTKIRATAAPIMAGPKADEVRKLIAGYGGSVSACPDAELANLLKKIEELA